MSDTETSNLDQVAITLSAMSYLAVDGSPEDRFKAISKALQITELPTGGNWGLVWGPHEHDQFLMFIVQGPETQFGRHYSLVIRGTVKKAWNIFVDLDVAGQSDIPWNAPDFPGGKLSWGVIDAWNKVKNLHQGSQQQTALDFLQNVDAGSAIMVTGHSLGGQLASAFASWLRSEINIPKKKLGVTPITFAAPTAGNTAFATPYEKVFPTGQRFHNDFDIVPRLWNYDDITSIRNLYPGSNTPKCDIENGCYAAVDAAHLWAEHEYLQTGGGVKLSSKLYSESGTWFPFEDEAGAQHSALLYMWLLGIKLDAIHKLYPADHWKPPQ